MSIRDPSHLGGFIRREILEPLGLSVTEAASALDVTRQTLSNLVNEKAMLTADMALRLEKAFGVSMELLMRMQLAYDLAQARARAGTIKVKRYKTALRQAS